MFSNILAVVLALLMLGLNIARDVKIAKNK